MDSNVEMDSDIRDGPSPGPSSTPSPPPPPPPATLPTASTSGKPTSTKPKSTKASRHRSHSASPPPVPRRPLETIRLEIKLGGPDNYEVDIAEVARAAGLRPPTPVRVRKRDTSDSEGDDEGDGKHKHKRKVCAHSFTVPTAPHIYNLTHQLLRRRTRSIMIRMILSLMIQNSLSINGNTLRKLSSRVSMYRVGKWRL
jgi:hypothetical protein